MTPPGLRAAPGERLPLRVLVCGGRDFAGREGRDHG